MSHRVVFGRHTKDCPGCQGVESPAPAKARTTAHSCGGPVFGKLTAGCARCDELAAGAAPVEWARSRRAAWDFDREYAHHKARCVICQTGRGVCTFGEW